MVKQNYASKKMQKDIEHVLEKSEMFNYKTTMLNQDSEAQLKPLLDANDVKMI